MSVNRPSRSVDDDSSASNFHNERNPPFGQDSIDQRLKRLREDVLPFYPFLLTVPTDVPFRLGNRFVNNWAVSDDGPFTPEEQQLQYMTFLTHHEGDSLLVAVGDWSDGTGNVMSDQRSGPQSAASTPSSGSLKKKISLSDYKNKRKTGASASPLSQEAIGPGTSTIHTFEDNQHRSKASPAKETSKSGGNPTSYQGNESHERKRPSRPDLEQLGSQERDYSDLASPKRPRLSPASSMRPDRRERSKPHKIPALLSPTLPPTSSRPKLPRLLSPTLPPDIEKELAKLHEDSTITESSQTKITSRTDTTRLRTHKPNSLDRNSSQLDSASAIGRQNLYNKAPNPAYNKPSSISLDATNSDSCETVKADAIHQKEAKPSQYGTLMKSRLIVKLRYGRANKKRIEALLKFSGKRKNLSRSPVKESADIEIPQGTKAERNSPKNLTSDRSHSRTPHTDARSKDISAHAAVPLRERSKDQKSTIQEKPETPGSSTQTSSYQPEKARQGSAAPSKDLQDLNPRPESVGSEKSLQARSKQASSDAVTVTRQSPLPSSNQTTARNGERRAWKDEHQKYAALGRELKHTAERHTARGNTTGSEEKLAAATAIEAILCFILAFVADDKSKALFRQTGDSTSWLSILAYWRVVKKNSAPYPRLYSLCLILGAVSYEAIHALDLERLAALPVPGEPTSVLTPDTDGTSAASDENKRSRKESLELKSRLPECYRESQRLWLEGCRGLTEDVLAREFPNTWTGRSRNYSEQGKQQLKAGDYSGEYFLPLGKTSTPVETVRFGDAMLKEWCINEGVEWKGRLSLS